MASCKSASEVSMHHEFIRDGNVGTLRITGDMDIESAQELKTVLLESLAGVDRLLLDMTGVSSIHLSCVQLLCSAHLTATGSGMEMSLIDTGRGPHDDATRYGFLRNTGCRRTMDGQCLWLERTTDL